METSDETSALSIVACGEEPLDQAIDTLVIDDETLLDEELYFGMNSEEVEDNIEVCEFGEKFAWPSGACLRDAKIWLAASQGSS